MNALLNYLEKNRAALALDEFGVSGSVSCLLKTPRFRASRHVIFLLFNEQEQQPCLVAKVARLPDDMDGIAREAANLRDVHLLHAGRLESIPSVIAHDQLDGFPFLVETALAGEPIGPKRVAREPSRWCQAVLDWLRLLDGPSSARTHASWNQANWEHLVAAPLDRCHRLLPWGTEATSFADCLQRLANELEDPSWPLVFEHGDLSHPNLIEYAPGQVGVIDWELAEPAGMPLHDLVFFLMYVALASSRDGSSGAQQASLLNAFRTGDGWAWKWVHQYLDERALPRSLAKPLMSLALLRYLDTTLARLKAENPAPNAQELSSELSAWFQQNRYFQFARELLAGRV